MKHQQKNLTAPRMTVVATFRIVYMILSKRNTTSVTSRTGTAYTSETPEKYKIALTKINYKKFKIYSAYTEHARTGIIIVM
jgi:hypothetical protein